MAQISHLLLLILATGACSAQDQWRPITERLVTFFSLTGWHSWRNAFPQTKETSGGRLIRNIISFALCLARIFCFNGVGVQLRVSTSFWKRAILLFFCHEYLELLSAQEKRRPLVVFIKSCWRCLGLFKFL
jgi:hypothetical protein